MYQGICSEKTLKENSVKLYDDLIKELLLSLLPENYKSIAELIKLHDKISLENVIATLQACQHDLNEATKQNSSSKIEVRNVVCHYCNRKGHIKRACKLYRAKTHTTEMKE